nr:PQQ-binding-like beta-propeller repeat protein [uncultured Methanolobus sp.]
MKQKQFALMVSAVMILALFASGAAASDWTQFQGNVENTGVTSDAGPGTSLSYIKGYTESSSWAGIDTAPLVVDNYVYTLGIDEFYQSTQGIRFPGPIVYLRNVWSVETGGTTFQNACPAYNDDDEFFCVVNTAYLTSQQPTFTFLDSDGNIVNNVDQLAFAPATHQCSSPVKYYNNDGVGLLFTGTANMSASDMNATDDGTYYCLYADNGTEYWSRDTQSGEGYYWAGAAIIEGTSDTYVVYGDDAGHLVSVTIDGTDVDEDAITTDEIRSSVCYNSNASVLYFTSKDGNIYCVEFDESTGEFGSVTSQSIGSSTSTPAYNDENQRVYVGSSSGVYCLEDDLTPIWSYTSTNGPVQASPVVSTGNSNPIVYVTTNAASGTLYAIEDLGSSCSVTSSTPSNCDYTLQGVAISGNYLYFGNDAGYVYRYS